MKFILGLSNAKCTVKVAVEKDGIFMLSVRNYTINAMVYIPESNKLRSTLYLILFAKEIL